MNIPVDVKKSLSIKTMSLCNSVTLLLRNFIKKKGAVKLPFGC